MKVRQAAGAIAEGALIAVSVVAAITLERLFVDLTFLRDVLVMVVASHLVAIACRRWRFKMGLSTLISAATLVLLGSGILYSNDSSFIFPTAETIRSLTDDLSSAGAVFFEDAAPVEPLRGFVVSVSVLIWFGAFLADSAAFRLRSFPEAIAPATSVLVLTSLLGADRNQVAHGIAYTAAMTAVLLSLRALDKADDDLWSTNESGPGVSTILRTGAIFGLVVIVVAGLVAPRIPGADSQPLLDLTELDDPPVARNIISPLVDVSASLVEHSDQEIFSVRVAEDERDYWRLMALTRFNGSQWERTSNFDEVRGPLGSEVDPSIENRTKLTQTVTKRSRGVDDIYLPVAYELSRVLDDGGVSLEYEVATGALVYQRSSQERAEQGFTYTIESLVPDYDPSQLPQRAAADGDEEFLAEHTQLPPICGPDESTTTHDCWPERVNILAREVTEGASNDYQRARMLQDYFRSPVNFSYDLNVAKRHDVRTAEDFLFNVRSGYCEQFATVFAAMARSLGLPTRVAVGYTWGSWDPERQEYVVRGHHAHAWPEVYFAGVGWIIFEPTPGRSRPHDSDITGHGDARQYPSNRTGALSESVSDFAPVGPNNSGRQNIPAPRPTTPETASDTASGSQSRSSGVGAVIRLILLVMGGIAALSVAAPTIRAIRRRRRLLRAAHDPIQRAELAWDDAIRALGILGLSPKRQQTPLEFAAEAERFRNDLGPLRELAANVTTLRYSDTSRVDPDDGEAGHGDYAGELALGAKEASAHIVDRCHTLAGLPRVALAAIDPRTRVDT